MIVELAKSKPRGWDAARYHGRSRSPYRRSRSRSGRGHSSRRRSRSRKRYLFVQISLHCAYLAHSNILLPVVHRQVAVTRQVHEDVQYHRKEALKKKDLKKEKEGEAVQVLHLVQNLGKKQREVGVQGAERIVRRYENGTLFI